MNQYDFRQKVFREEGHEKENLRHIHKLKRRALVFVIAYIFGFLALSWFEGIITALIVVGMLSIHNEMGELLRQTKKWILNKKG